VNGDSKTKGERKISSEWPDAIIALAGAWPDFPAAQKGAGMNYDKDKVDDMVLALPHLTFDEQSGRAWKGLTGMP